MSRTLPRIGSLLPSVTFIMSGLPGREPVDEMIPVSAASIPQSIRREYNSGWLSGSIGNYWSEAYAPTGSDGCKYGCKVYVRKSGAVVRWAVLHSSTYGHPRPQSTS